MIQAVAFRIGNYFHPTSERFGLKLPATGILYRISSINKFGEVEVIEPKEKESKKFMLSEIAPVRLTPEILKGSALVDMGQEKFQNDDFIIQIDYDNDPVFYYLKPSGKHLIVDYVHQLQNLYFELQQKELELNL